MSVTPQYEHPAESSFFADEMHDDLDLMDVEEEAFVDAPEHQESEHQNIQNMETGVHSNESNNANHATLPTASPANVEEKRKGGNDAFEVAQPDVEHQMKVHSQHRVRRALYDPAEETPVISAVNKSAGADKYRAAYEAATLRASYNQGQHSSGCSGARGASTPPATPPPDTKSGFSSQQDIKLETKSGSGSHSDVKPEVKVSEPPWEGPDDLRDVAKFHKRLQRQHARAVPLLPNLPIVLPEHRYWVGVKNPGRPWSTVTKESHFTWMKGNRLTTVETVRKIYAATTMTEGVLILGEERPEDTDRMEELDYFNDKVILFSIVTEGSEGSQGRLLTEGLVTKEIEVIELDD